MVRFSRFIAELDFCRSHFLQVGDDLLDVRTKFFGPLGSEFLRGAGNEGLNRFR